MNIDFSGAEVLVIGDCMLDRYHFGSVGRISPEAPVPVVRVTRSSDTLGGAGNVGNNCAHLGARVTVVGAIGNDESGAAFRRLCRANGINLLSLPAHGRTTVKTRVIGEHQQIVRIDFEDAVSLPEAKEADVRRAIAGRLAAVTGSSALRLWQGSLFAWPLFMGHRRGTQKQDSGDCRPQGTRLGKIPGSCGW